jgi:flagellar hook assembly protein FlgD
MAVGCSSFQQVSRMNEHFESFDCQNRSNDTLQAKHMINHIPKLT